MRIYELAKELGVENKVIIAKAQQLGMEGKKSHSNSLTDDEATKLRRVFIREAVGETSKDSEVVKTQVDTKTGEEKTIVERRKGNVVRRRKAKKSVPEKSVEVKPAIESALSVSEAAEDLFVESRETVAQQ